MRRRLIIVFLIPTAVILLVLGGAYAWSTARGIQQEISNQQLGDLSYFLTGARSGLRAGNPEVVEGELQRYSELYGSQVAVFDRSATVWASGGVDAGAFDDETMEQVGLALSGRRSEPSRDPLWFGTATTVEPVFDDGIVIGAALISTSPEAPRNELLAHLVALVAVSAVVIALLVFAAFRLAHWVLRPMLRVDRAMAAIEHGEMGARIADDTGPPEMRRMIGMFNQMAGEIERVVSRQQEFAMNASHELRNPLGALMLRVEYLATGLDSRWEADIEEAREEGRRMSRILDTLLGMARAGRPDSAFAPIDLADVAADRVDAWRDVARELRVELLVSGDASASSLADRTSVETALDAVLDNALKFAPAGTAIDVVVTGPGDAATGGGGAARECAISVRDRGRGLDPEDLARATDRFWRSPRDQNIPGSGLGLAIAHDLLEALGGRIELSAPDDGGLRVSLHLPSGDRP
ncbi:sensor histidine kinase [Leucobacter zeae]|nr:sensor histidine kinase [Leucobacter zeae]